MNFHQFLIILQARYKIALSVLFGTVTLALIVSSLMPNKYVASTSLVLDVKSPDPLVSMSLNSGMMMPSYMATQTDIITSDRVAQGAVKLLKLDEDNQVREQWRKATGGKGQLVSWLGGLLAKKLDVKPSRDSNVINISFSADDPAFAATAANAFAQSYIDTNLELKVEPARQYAQWFQARVATLRAELEKAQSRLAAFQEKSGMYASGGRTQNLDNSKLAELSGQLVMNESQMADIQSKKKFAGAGNTLAEVMQNPVIVGLKENIIRLEGKLHEAGNNLGKNHPQYQAMESEIAALKQKLDAETKHILNSINTADNVNKQKSSELKATIEGYKKQAIEDSALRDQIAVLENDVESAQKAYDFVMQRYTESNLQSQSSQTNISVLTPAVEPIEPSSPKILKNLLIAVFAGTMLGVGAAFLTEMFSQRVRTPEALGAATGVPVLAQFSRHVESSGIKAKGFRIGIGRFRFGKAIAV
ncbi:MAG: chain length determinant protein EpsF [Nitrosomonadales bacterium]|nr:chain length determinant protein EpsF [Nitrosomonadales bacterium]